MKYSNRARTGKMREEEEPESVNAFRPDMIQRNLYAKTNWIRERQKVKELHREVRIIMKDGKLV